MVISARGALTVALLAASGCLSTAANDYLFSCANGQSCPSHTTCASDDLCHPVFTPGAGPADAGSYVCASASPQCPDGDVCGADGLCGAADGGAFDAGDAGDAGPPDSGPPDAGTPDAGDAGLRDAGTDAGPSCDLATAFAGAAAYPCGNECSGLAVADFNHDGFNDVALAISDSTGPQGGVVLLLNGGDGTLSAPIPSLGLFPCGGDISNPSDYSAPDALAVGDFNGDGWPDLGLSISEASTLALALNGQDGGFIFGTPQPATSPGCTYLTGGYPYSAIADYQPQGSDWYLASVGFGLTDADGDSVVAFSKVQSNSLNLDPWTTLLPASTLTPVGLAIDPLGTGSQASLALAESDGTSDEVEVYPPTTQGGQAGFASSPSATLVSHGETANVAIADLDGDGLNDLVAVNAGDNTISVFYAKSGGFRTAVSFSTVIGDAGSVPAAAVIADLDGDGRPDIATVNNSGNVTLLRGMPDGGFLAVGALLSHLPVAAWIAAADLEDPNARDGGRPDLVISSLTGSSASSVEVFQNNCR